MTKSSESRPIPDKLSSNLKAVHHWTKLSHRVHPSKDVMLVLLCETLAIADNATEVIAKSDLMIRDGEGRILPSPLLKIREDQIALASRLIKELGLFNLTFETLPLTVNKNSG